MLRRLIGASLTSKQIPTQSSENTFPFLHHIHGCQAWRGGPPRWWGRDWIANRNISGFVIILTKTEVRGPACLIDWRKQKSRVISATKSYSSGTSLQLPRRSIQRKINSLHH